jgi:hypothetical protein
MELRIRKIEKIAFNSPQLQLGVYEYYGMALAQKFEKLLLMRNLG